MAIIKMAPKSSIIAKAVKKTFNDKGTLFPNKDNTIEISIDDIKKANLIREIKV